MHHRRLQNQFKGRYDSLIGLESAWLGGFAWSGVPTLARSGYFLASLSDSKQFSNGSIVWYLMIQNDLMILKTLLV